MIPDPGCNSASAQFIAQASCLGQTNCTIDVKQNSTFQWEETATAPCGEGLIDKRQCYVGLLSPNSNFTTCPKLQEDYRCVASF
jgi:hypothetical protein